MRWPSRLVPSRSWAGPSHGYSAEASRKASLAESSAATERAALRVEVVTPHGGAQRSRVGAPRQREPARRDHHLFAGQRLRDKMAGRHWRQGRRGPAARRDRHARARPRARASQGRARLGRGHRHAGQGEPRLLAEQPRALPAARAPTGVASQQELEQKRRKRPSTTRTSTVARAAVGRASKPTSGASCNSSRSPRSSRPSRAPSRRAPSSAARWSRAAYAAMFKIAIVDPVRVFVQVPQDVAPSVRADIGGEGHRFAEFPGRDVRPAR